MTGEENLDEQEQAINQLLNLGQQKDVRIESLSRDLAASQYVHKDQNLIAFQLETPELLQKLERFYRGDYITTDEDGNIIWKKQKNKDLVPFNDYGVNLLMEIVTKYIDKNTVLSSYKEERIYEILGDLGDEITLSIYCNYEKMGMDTPFKKTKFRLLVVTTLHTIESAYRRALEGQTSKDVNQSRLVHQYDPMTSRTNGPIFQPKKSIWPFGKR
jgi:hypothetical protein